MTIKMIKRFRQTTGGGKLVFDLYTCATMGLVRHILSLFVICHLYNVQATNPPKCLCQKNKGWVQTKLGKSDLCYLFETTTSVSANLSQLQGECLSKYNASLPIMKNTMVSEEWIKLARNYNHLNIQIWPLLRNNGSKYKCRLFLGNSSLSTTSKGCTTPSNCTNCTTGLACQWSCRGDKGFVITPSGPLKQTGVGVGTTESNMDNYMLVSIVSGGFVVLIAISAVTMCFLLKRRRKGVHNNETVHVRTKKHSTNKSSNKEKSNRQSNKSEKPDTKNVQCPELASLGSDFTSIGGTMSSDNEFTTRDSEQINDESSTAMESFLSPV